MRRGVAVALVLCACNVEKTPSVVAIDPPDGSGIGSKCPVRVQFADSIDDASFQVGGSMPNGEVAVVFKTTEHFNDTAELYPQTGNWNLGVQTFEFEAQDLATNGVRETVGYLVTQTPDEQWRRSEAHDTGKFINGSVRDVWFANATTGYAVGSSLVLKTTDGGATWTNVAPDHALREAVWGIDASTVWAITEGGGVDKTTDGGATWSRVSQLSPFLSPIWELRGIGPSLMFVTGSEGVHRSTDGGATWQTVIYDPPHVFTGLYLRTADDIWVTDAGGIVMRSLDGGTTWTSTPAGLGFVWTIGGDGTGRVWIGGEDEMLAVSTNGAASWTVQHGATDGETMVGFHAETSEEAWAIGDGGSVFLTTNGGAVWSVDEGRFPSGLARLEGRWIAGHDGLVASTDDGSTWTQRTDGWGKQLVAVWALDESTIITAGDGGGMLTTTNGGQTWAKRNAGNADFTDVWGLGDERWAVDVAGAVVYSSNAGASWSTKAVMAEPLLGIFGVDSDHLWAVGDVCGPGAAIHRTEDGGESWDSVVLAEAHCFVDVWAHDQNRVWAVGYDSPNGGIDREAVVAMSEDGGETWTVSMILDTAYLTSIYGADANRLWVGGIAFSMGPTGLSQPLVQSTDDGGLTWTREWWGPTNIDEYHGMWVSGGELVWGVGGYFGPGLFSTANACNAPAIEPVIGYEWYDDVHGTADGQHVWIVGRDGFMGTLDR